MILADKIINERKRNGWSQEELAEKLSVSRQSVSKWEGAQAVPDLQKIIKMADLFGVSTDYLLRDEIEEEQTDITREEVSSDVPARKVSMEEASEYLQVEKKNAPWIAGGVSLCIASPALLIFLAGISEKKYSIITENTAAGIGICVLLLMVAAAVYLFIRCSADNRAYEYLEYEIFETGYGVSGMVAEKKRAYESVHTGHTAMGTVLCILSVIPLIVAGIMETEEYIVTSMVSVVLLLVAFGVNLLVRTEIIWQSFEKLLQNNDYTPGKKRVKKTIEKVAAIYWSFVTAIYLLWSFGTMRWDFTWLVWPVAGVLYGVVRAITGIAVKEE